MEESKKPSGNHSLLLLLLSIPGFLTLKTAIYGLFPVEYWGKPSTAMTYYPMNIFAWVLFLVVCWVIGKAWAKQRKFIKIGLGLAMLLAFIFFGIVVLFTRTSPITPKSCYAENLARVDGCTSESPSIGFMDTPYRQITYGKPNLKLCQDALQSSKSNCPSFLDATQHVCVHIKDEEPIKEKTQIFARDCKKAAVFISKGWDGSGYSHDPLRFKDEILKYFRVGF